MSRREVHVDFIAIHLSFRPLNENAVLVKRVEIKGASALFVLSRFLVFFVLLGIFNASILNPYPARANLVFTAFHFLARATVFAAFSISQEKLLGVKRIFIFECAVHKDIKF